MSGLVHCGDILLWMRCGSFNSTIWFDLDYNSPKSTHASWWKKRWTRRIFVICFTHSNRSPSKKILSKVWWVRTVIHPITSNLNVSAFGIAFFHFNTYFRLNLPKTNIFWLFFTSTRHAFYDLRGVKYYYNFETQDTSEGGTEMEGKTVRETPTANEVRKGILLFWGKSKVGETSSMWPLLHNNTAVIRSHIIKFAKKGNASKVKNCFSRWWSQTVFIFTPIFGVSWSQFDVCIFFQMGSEQPPTSYPLEGFVLIFLIKKAGIYEAAARWLGDSRGAIVSWFFFTQQNGWKEGIPIPPKKSWRMSIPRDEMMMQWVNFIE